MRSNLDSSKFARFYQYRVRNVKSLSYPALFVGIDLLCGAAAALTGDLFYLLIPLFLRALFRTGFWKGVFFTLAAYGYTLLIYPPAVPQGEAVPGQGIFAIRSLKISSSAFGKTYLYEGTFSTFADAEGNEYRNLPCCMMIPLKKNRPAASCNYRVEGILCPKEGRHFFFKPKKWTPLPEWSAAEWRFQAKKAVSGYLKRRFKDPKTASFFASLATGDIDERALSLEFGKIGLNHLLAISGFHFALLAAFCGFILRLVFSHKTATVLLLILLSAYFFFIGNAPSVQRAWIGIFIFLIGSLFDLRSNGLNSLGCALIIEILLDPFCATHLGFQLSFLATLAILLFYQPCEKLLMPLFPKRPLSLLARMTPLHQTGALLSTLLRKALALNFAVHLVTLPVLLYTFQKFPLLSLLYNLFFPFWVGISIFLLLFSLIFPPLHAVNNAFTSTLLELTSNPPALWQFYLRTQSLPYTFVIALLLCFFCLGILFKEPALRKTLLEPLMVRWNQATGYRFLKR